MPNDSRDPEKKRLPRVTINEARVEDEEGATVVRPGGPFFAVNLTDGLMSIARNPVAHLPQATAKCGKCHGPVTYRPDEDPTDRVPCPACGSTDRLIGLELHDQAHVDSYVSTKHTAKDRDRSLPGKGIVRSYSGVRTGRDGRRVFREAHYDPLSDEARERVVDVESGDVIVDKVESMGEKYQARGRWTPPEDPYPADQG